MHLKWEQQWQKSETQWTDMACDHFRYQDCGTLFMGGSISLEKHEEMCGGIVPKYLMSQRQPLVQIGYFKIGIKNLFYYRWRVTRKECTVSNF